MIEEEYLDCVDAYVLTTRTRTRIVEDETPIPTGSLSLAQWRVEQRQDDVGKEVAEALERKDVTTVWSKEVRKMMDGACLRDGLIYLVTGGRGRVWVPGSLRQMILTEAHDDPMSGHGGTRRTLARIKKTYDWFGVRADVEKWIGSCQSCQTFTIGETTLTRKHETGEVGGAPPFPFHTIAIDIKGPLPVSGKSKAVFLIVIIDCLSRYVEAYPTKDHTAETVANCLVAMIRRHGVPVKIISDRGTEFISIMFRNLCKFMGIAQSDHPPYAPWMNGRVERVNGTLARILSHYVDKYWSDWDEKLPFVLMAYNSSEHEATGLSPYKMIHGRDPTSWTEALLGVEGLNEPYDMVLTRLLNEAQRVSRAAPAQIVVSRFTVGDQVMLLPVKTSIGGKSLRHNTGPHTVVEIKIDSIVISQHNSDNICVHASRLQMHHQRVPSDQRAHVLFELQKQQASL
jgi:hypothetical protein